MIKEIIKQQEDFPKMFTSKAKRTIQDYGRPGLFSSSKTNDFEKNRP